MTLFKVSLKGVPPREPFLAAVALHSQQLEVDGGNVLC